MNPLAILSLALGIGLSACSRPVRDAAAPVAPRQRPTPTPQEIGAVSPALARYTTDTVRGDLWNRPGLSRRDRSLVTVAALIARSQTTELPSYLELALDEGVKPSEISEVITHLAFYAGWPSAMSSVVVTKEVFDARGITPDRLPPAARPLLPLDEAAEATRARRVSESFGAIAPGVVADTTHLLFRELWLRPALAPRDRSVVTVSALIATGQAAQLGYHLDRAMDRGLTRAEVSEVLSQLAFITGWPSVFTSLPVVKEVLEKRS